MRELKPKIMKVEFISERKIVKTMSDVAKAVSFAKELQKSRVKDQTSMETIWKEVGKLLQVDPFLPLSIRVVDKNKIVGKQQIWGNTL